MSETIKDGRGRGNVAEVNDSQQLMTFSVIETEESKLLESGYSFTTSSKILTLNNTNEHMIIYLKNLSSTLAIKFRVIHIGWNGGSTNHNRCLKWDFVGKPNKPSANYTVITPGNLNFASNNLPDALVYKWDGVGTGMTYTGGSVITEYIVGQGETPYYLDGVPLFRLNDSAGIVVAGEEVGEVSITVRFYNKEI